MYPMQHTRDFPSLKKARVWGSENLKGSWFIKKVRKGKWQLTFHANNLRIIPAWLDPMVNES